MVTDIPFQTPFKCPLKSLSRRPAPVHAPCTQSSPQRNPPSWHARETPQLWLWDNEKLAISTACTTVRDCNRSIRLSRTRWLGSTPGSSLDPCNQERRWLPQAWPTEGEETGLMGWTQRGQRHTLESTNNAYLFFSDCNETDSVKEVKKPATVKGRPQGKNWKRN